MDVGDADTGGLHKHMRLPGKVCRALSWSGRHKRRNAVWGLGHLVELPRPPAAAQPRSAAEGAKVLVSHFADEVAGQLAAPADQPVEAEFWASVTPPHRLIFPVHAVHVTPSVDSLSPVGPSTARLDGNPGHAEPPLQQGHTDVKVVGKTLRISHCSVNGL